MALPFTQIFASKYGHVCFIRTHFFCLFSWKSNYEKNAKKKNLSFLVIEKILRLALFSLFPIASNRDLSIFFTISKLFFTLCNMATMREKRAKSLQIFKYPIREANPIKHCVL